MPELCRTHQRVETTYLVLLSSCVVCNDRIQWAISGLGLFVQVSDIPKSLNDVKTNISHPGFVTAYIKYLHQIVDLWWIWTCVVIIEEARQRTILLNQRLSTELFSRFVLLLCLIANGEM